MGESLWNQFKRATFNFDWQDWAFIVGCLFLVIAFVAANVLIISPPANAAFKVLAIYGISGGLLIAISKTDG